jgi:tetratricopeptide (TPR) repeat protein
VAEPAQFGSALRQLRSERGVSLTDLADMIHYSKSYLSRIENSERTATAKLAQACDHALDGEGVLIDTQRLASLRMPARRRSTPPGASRDAVPGLARGVPHQLPAQVPHFTGRISELKVLSELAGAVNATQAPVVVAISGSAGVGKTALAVCSACRTARRFDGGQLYVNLRGFDPASRPVDPAEALRGFLDALAVPATGMPIGVDARAALYRSLVADRRVLVLLDNARDETQVRPLLPGASNCLVIITSRNELTGLVAAEGVNPIALGLLNLADAHQLLSVRLGVERVMREPEAAGELALLCARLPLALNLAAAQAVTHPGLQLAHLASKLRNARSRLDALDSGDLAADARAAFACSYRALSGPASRLFRLLSLDHAPTVSIEVAARLIGQDTGRASDNLAALARMHLLTQPRPARFTFHDLLRAYAAERANAEESADALNDATRRMLDYYLHSAYRAAMLLQPTREPVTPPAPLDGVTPHRCADAAEALSWFDLEYPSMITACDTAADRTFDTHAQLLPWTLVTYLDRRGRWQEQVATQRLALAAAGRSGDLAAQARAHHEMAKGHIRLGSYELAGTHLDHSLRYFQTLNATTGLARSHLTLARLRARQNRYADAIGHATQALQLYRRAGKPVGQANSLNSLGWYCAHIGESQRAIGYCQEALTLHLESGNRYGQAAAHDSLGNAFHRLARYAEAIASYTMALSLFQDIDDRHGQAEILGHIGDAHHANGELSAASTAWRQALDLLEELQHPDLGQVRAKIQAMHEADSARQQARPGLVTPLLPRVGR